MYTYFRSSSAGASLDWRLGRGSIYYMFHLISNKSPEERVRDPPHTNTEYFFEQILEATLKKTAAIRSLVSQAFQDWLVMQGTAKEVRMNS